MSARAATSLRVEGVRKAFAGSEALGGITLDFVTGGFNTLLGPSGCGKTTLLRIVAGFEQPDAGRVLIGGQDRTGQPVWRRRIGFVFQSYALWPHKTVFENVAYGLRLRGLGRADVASRVEGALRTMGLDGAGARSPGHLSGGQQQRVALARALVLEPDLLLLDEPLSNLDARLRVEMRREIRRVQREVGVTTVYVTHDQEEALELSDVVAVMSRGRVEQTGPPQEVYGRPRSEAVAAFLGTVTLLDGRGTGKGRVETAGQTLAADGVAAGGRVRVAVRPEDVDVQPAAAADASAATVQDCAYLGHAFRVRVALDGGQELLAHTRTAVAPGERVWVRIRAASVLPGEDG
jgi:ABC-type Fe3+/spermidine/putrescine transport system ATPase subunit